ncbi:hypothetical protein [Marinobacter maritimus]|uniref:hypothetical protein n=1 Tax=Marinobacter maritimus TaxID=277961 RepID=UPI00119F5728|nr:hypothetical protein [Marinobacter maritimus]
MSYLIKVVILLSALVAQASWAQQTPSAFAYSEIILEERAVESPKVVVVYSKASGVLEIRFQECDDCEYRALSPADGITFSVGGKSLLAETASGTYRNSPGTVFIDASSSKVNRVHYFQTRSGGDE